jgi:hypothetical protein
VSGGSIKRVVPSRQGAGQWRIRAREATLIEARGYAAKRCSEPDRWDRGSLFARVGAARRLADTFDVNMSPRFRLLRLVALLAAVHLALALGSLATSYTLGMSRFDAAEFREPSPIERVANGASNVLFQPVMFVLGVLAPGSHSRLVQWLAFGFNSLLWGLAVALVFRRLTRHSTWPPSNGPSVPPAGPGDLVR